MHKKFRIAVSSALLLGLAACEQEEAPVSFSNDIKPILTAKCLACHDGTGEGSEASGFSVVSYEDIMRGTQFGSVIEPGDRVSSTFFRLIAQKTDPTIQMPPHGEGSVSETALRPLRPEEVEAIGLWIDQGAMKN